MAHHGVPRYTGDIDLYVKPDKENAQRIINALTDFGFGDLDLSKDDFIQPKQIIQLGQPPARVDIISGVTWEEADAGKIEGTCGGIAVNFVGREQFVKNKRATGRKKDIADLESLGESSDQMSLKGT